jgi:hypothetical protein
MTVKGGRHQLTGMVSLGHFHDTMENIKSGKKITMLLMKNITSKLYHVLFLFRSVICRFSNTPSTIYLPQRFSISTSTFSNKTMSTLYIVSVVFGKV